MPSHGMSAHSRMQATGLAGLVLMVACGQAAIDGQHVARPSVHAVLHRFGHGGLRLRGGAQPSALVTRDLYGKAIRLGLPPSYDDISQFRQVPDHQEVWVDRDSNRSIIVELLDLDEDCPDSEVADRIFRDCALANNATHVGLYSQRRLRNSEVPLLMKDPPCPPAWISLWMLSGYQNVAKFNNEDRDHVNVHLFVARLQNVRTDVCIFFNQPLNSPPTSESPTAVDVSTEWEEGSDILASIAHSLQVCSWEVFGEGNG